MRFRTLALLTGVLVIGSTFAAGASGKVSASPKTFSTILNIKQEVPKETGAPANASGKFTATLTGTKLKWVLTFTHLTGKATAAHIHLGARGKSGAVIVPLCTPCKVSTEEGQN